MVPGLCFSERLVFGKGALHIGEFPFCWDFSDKTTSSLQRLRWFLIFLVYLSLGIGKM